MCLWSPNRPNPGPIDEFRDFEGCGCESAFAGHISSLLEAGGGMMDVVLVFGGGEKVGIHRFLLAARVPLLREKLLGEWEEMTVVNMPKSVDCGAFRVIRDYIYLRTDSLAIDDEEIQEGVVELARKYGLVDLVEGVEEIRRVKGDDKQKSKLKHDLSVKFIETARRELDQFLRETIYKEKISIPLDLNTIDLEDLDCQEYLSPESKSALLEADSIPDIIIACLDSESESIVYYPVHRSILARSEYFDTMFKSEIFQYSQEEIPTYKDHTLEIINRPQLQIDHIPVIQLCTSADNHEIAEMILSYLYHDDVKQIPLELCIELLFAADELFLERLKTMCAVTITTRFPDLNYEEFQSFKATLGADAYDLIRISWQTRCDKLEHHITKSIAYNLQPIFNSKQERTKFSQLVQESAARIKERQETDTIELIDDIRYYLGKKHAVFQFVESFDPGFRNLNEVDDIGLYKNAVRRYERDIDIIDSLLDELDLEA